MAKNFVHISGEAADEQALSLDYENAKKFGLVRVGKSFLFNKKFASINYVPLESVKWAYMRMEDYNAKLCCGGAILSSYYIVAHGGDGELIRAELDRRETVEELLQALREASPNINIGYTEQNKVLHEESANKLCSCPQ